MGAANCTPDTGKPHSHHGPTVQRFRAMFTSPTPQFPIRELDHRTNDGIDVRLFWNSRTNHVFVAVEDQRSGMAFELIVSGADALDAFRHPYAYGGSDLLPIITRGAA